MAQSDETSGRQKIILSGSGLKKDAQADLINITVPWYLSSARYPPRTGNAFEIYFSGEEVFGAIAESIKNANSSIDIVTMGFDPAMPLVRTDKTYREDYIYEKQDPLGKQKIICSPWREEDAYGRLLLDALVANPKLKIRIVLWYAKGHSVVGLTDPWSGRPNLATSISTTENETGFDPKAYDAKKELKNLPLRRRHPRATLYSAEWFYKLRYGEFEGSDRIAVVLRDIKDHPIEEEDPRILGESATLSWPADHQKAILFDFDDDDHKKRHGYVMGHNSQTQYWSSRKFIHRDIKSEMDCRPYHDFSIRIQGPLTIDLNENFCEAWGKNRKHLLSFKSVVVPVNDQGYFPIRISRAIELEDPAVLLEQRKKRYADIERQKCGESMGQIVRTRPDRRDDLTPIGQEKEIKDAYLNATRNARNYILIVNQYCQYQKLARHIKYWWKAASDKGYKGQLYLFMGTCKPEYGGQVFRAHQMANELGLGDQFPTVEKEFYVQEKNENVEEKDKLNPNLTGRGSIVGGDYESPAIQEKMRLNQDKYFQGRTDWGVHMGATPKIPMSMLEDLGIFPLFFMFYTQIPKLSDGEKKSAPREKTLAQQVYVHAKLMVEDDLFFTLGSANLNMRSLAVDSELNLISADTKTAQKFRKELFDFYVEEPDIDAFPNREGLLNQDDLNTMYMEMKKLLARNKKKISKGEPIQGHVSLFEDNRSASTRIG